MLLPAPLKLPTTMVQLVLSACFRSTMILRKIPVNHAKKIMCFPKLHRNVSSNTILSGKVLIPKISTPRLSISLNL